MSIYSPSHLITIKQAVDLSNATVGSALKLTATGVALADGATDQVVGYLNTRPNVATVGYPVSVQVSGTREAIAHAAVAAGAALNPTAVGGRVGVAANTAAGALARCGIAITAATGAGDSFTIRIV